MKKNLTELVFILDRSGSMAGLEDDTVGGFNAMIEKQKKQEGECLVSTVLFDTENHLVHDRLRLSDVPKLTQREYTPGGCTALLDAIGESVSHISKIHRYAREEDVPEHTMFVITTDGMENASRRYDAAEVKEMIRRQKEKFGWEFIFMGANIDAIETAKKYGIDPSKAVNYHRDSHGTKLNYEVMSETISSVRENRPLTSAWKKRIDRDFAQRNPAGKD